MEAGTVAGSTATGAAKGAAIGSVVPGIGTAVGAVVGAVVGFVEGIFSSKADEAQKAAAAEMNNEVQRTQAVQRRNIVRDLYQKRADAVAASASESGGLQSSLGEGGIGSVDSQGQFNLGYFDSQVVSGKIIQNYTKKAQNYASNAGLINSAFGVAGSLANTFGGGGGGGGVTSQYSTDDFANSIPQQNVAFDTSNVSPGNYNYRPVPSN